MPEERDCWDEYHESEFSDFSSLSKSLAEDDAGFVAPVMEKAYHVANYSIHSKV